MMVICEEIKEYTREMHDEPVNKIVFPICANCKFKTEPLDGSCLKGISQYGTMPLPTFGCNDFEVKE